jgi:hypothetical protein
MKFEQALNESIEDMSKKLGKDFKISGPSLNITAIIWNMVAKAKNKLDDIVVIDDSNNIISIPISKAVESNGEQKEEKPVKESATKARPTPKTTKK